MITAYCKSKYFKKDYCMFVPNLIWHLFGAGSPNDMLVYGLLLDAWLRLHKLVRLKS